MRCRTSEKSQPCTITLVPSHCTMENVFLTIFTAYQCKVHRVVARNVHASLLSAGKNYAWAIKFPDACILGTIKVPFMEMIKAIVTLVEDQLVNFARKLYSSQYCLKDRLARPPDTVTNFELSIVEVADTV